MDIKKPDSPAATANTVQSRPQTSLNKAEQSNNQTNSQTNQATNNAHSQQTFKVGQLLELLVIKTTNSRAYLEVLGRNLSLHTQNNDALQIGQKLRAQITQTQPSIQLKVLPQHNAESNNIKALINNTLRQVLPKQQPLQELIQNLNQLIKQDSSNSQSLQNIKNAFFQSSPPLQAFSEASVLPKIFKRSGLFTENLLANFIKTSNQKSNFPNNDLKISLLRLAEQLRSIQPEIPKQKFTHTESQSPLMTYTPTSIKHNQKSHFTGSTQDNKTSTAKNQHSAVILASQEQVIDKLLRLTEGTIAKLQTQQLQQQQLNDTQKPSWIFELPIRNDTSLDSLIIYINKDNSNKHSEYLSPWKLIIKLSIETLGDIQANVSLRGNKLSVTFWLDNPETSKLFSNNAKRLEAKINKTGLISELIKCRCDTPPNIPIPWQEATISEQI